MSSESIIVLPIGNQLTWDQILVLEAAANENASNDDTLNQKVDIFVKESIK